MKVPKIEVVYSSTLGKKDKKLINRSLEGMVLENSAEYKIHKCKNKLSFITKEGKPILFSLHNSKYTPTIKILEDGVFLDKVAYLDEGALKPVLNGADIMCPGIYRCKDKISSQWDINDVVAIQIIGKGLIAIGIATMASKNITEKAAGVCINVVHRRGDHLYEIRMD